jgi:hypothetical protein
MHRQLNQSNQSNQLNEFQQLVKERFKSVLEIYYENHVHKKFLADMYAVIPKGRKCALWFTHKQCWMFQISKRVYQPSQPGQFKQQSNHSEPVSFDDVRMMQSMPCMDDAWYSGEGTILYGTCLTEKGGIKKRFSVENVHYLCGAKQIGGGMERFIAFFDAYNKQKCKPDAPLQFFMPIMHTSFNDALKDAQQITSYEVFCIQHRFLQRSCTEYKNLLLHLAEQPQQLQPSTQSQPSTHSSMQLQPTVTAQSRTHSQSFFPRQANVIQTQNQTQNQTQKPQGPMRTFVVRPDAQNDIYYVLHNADDAITDATMIAHIPNYKTSVMMNSIFRNIKENRNLDALEESDDEEEFVDADKNKNRFVDLSKCVRMTCMFNHRFKRWQPCACAY